MNLLKIHLSKTGIFLTSLSTGSLASAGSKGLFFTSGNSAIDTSYAGSLTSVVVGEGGSLGKFIKSDNDDSLLISEQKVASKSLTKHFLQFCFCCWWGRLGQGFQLWLTYRLVLSCDNPRQRTVPD